MTRRRRLLFNANDYCIRNRTIFLSGYDKGEAERGGEGRAGSGERGRHRNHRITQRSTANSTHSSYEATRDILMDSKSVTSCYSCMLILKY